MFQQPLQVSVCVAFCCQSHMVKWSWKSVLLVRTEDKPRKQPGQEPKSFGCLLKRGYMAHIPRTKTGVIFRHHFCHVI
ncbi:hypothetical protein XELAEV_18024975mg [Xenopus laevis]|uniref:Uncharacterized protein n=1 Tax=Xenopus laevis TaxID=8355 RepID=A0A974HLQ3_XENLA|nr:hypothetical protein XELAEV_18024975mg [Xenopus laevis]